MRAAEIVSDKPTSRYQSGQLPRSPFLANSRPKISKSVMQDVVNSSNALHLAGTLVTLLLPAFATHMLVPSKARENGWFPTG